MSEKQSMHGAPNRGRMTYADLLELPDDGLRHELIDGEHFVTPSPKLPHQIIAGNLYLLIGNYLREHRIGLILFAPFDVVFTRDDVVEPDLLYFSSARFEEVVTENNAQGAPNLAVEILSATTRRRDEVLKRRLYERMGVDEYWIVDPKVQTVKVHRLESGKYHRSELALEDGDVLTTPLFPGLKLPLKAIFELPEK